VELWVVVPNLYFYSGRTSNVMTIIFAYYYYTIHRGVPSNGGIVMASSFEEKSGIIFNKLKKIMSCFPNQPFFVRISP